MLKAKQIAQWLKALLTLAHGLDSTVSPHTVAGNSVSAGLWIDRKPSPILYRHQAHMWCTDRNASKPIHT